MRHFSSANRWPGKGNAKRFCKRRAERGTNHLAVDAIPDGHGYATPGARDGLTGMMAIHPSQVPAINAAFTPTAEQLTEARRIVDAFAAAPNAGALQLEGAMLDVPHLRRAQALLARMGDYA